MLKKYAATAEASASLSRRIRAEPPAAKGRTARTADTLTIVDTAGKRTDFAAESIDELEPLSTSLMPEQLLRDLTAGQAADLLSYLETLR